MRTGQSSGPAILSLGCDAGSDLASLLAGLGAEIVAMLRSHGAVRLPGSGVRCARQLAAARHALGWRSGANHEPFAPREDHGAGVYSWPQWSARREMCMHHEQCYTVDPPDILLMANVGSTASHTVLLADTRVMPSMLPHAVVSRVREEGWLFVRNFVPRLGLPWTTVLGTDDRAEAEQVCAARDIDHAWAPNGGLRLRQLRAGIVRHPESDVDCWHNDLAFMSRWSIADAERQILINTLGEEHLPFDTAFGSGAPLGRDEFLAILGAYDDATVAVQLDPGDLLLVDNVMTAHGRGPYQDSWDVLTALGTNRAPDIEVDKDE